MQRQNSFYLETIVVGIRNLALARYGDNATDEIPSATERAHKVTKKEMKKMIALLEQSRAEWVERCRVNGMESRAEINRLHNVIEDLNPRVEF